MAGKKRRIVYLAATLVSFGFLLLLHPGERLFQATAATEPPEEEQPVTETQIPDGEEEAPEETPIAPQVPPPSQPSQPRSRPATPQRRGASPTPLRSDMVSLNFNRADLIEIVHVIA